VVSGGVVSGGVVSGQRSVVSGSVKRQRAVRPLTAHQPGTKVLAAASLALNQRREGSSPSGPIPPSSVAWPTRLLWEQEIAGSSPASGTEKLAGSASDRTILRVA
jgi:hypothetical protein